MMALDNETLYMHTACRAQFIPYVRQLLNGLRNLQKLEPYPFAERKL